MPLDANIQTTDQTLRICHLDTELEWRGGQQQVLYLAKGLVRLGHTAVIAARPKAELARRAAAEGIEVLPFRLTGPFNPLAAAKLTAILRERKMDLLHLHTGRACSLGGFIGRYERSLPIVVTRRVDFLLKQGCSLSFKYGKHVDRIIAISQGVKQSLLQSGISEERIDIVHSGIDLHRWEGPQDPEGFRARHNIPAGVPLIGTVGALTDHKGHVYFIRCVPLVLKRFPDAHFVLVGDGELRPSLAEEAQRTGHGDRIHFTGFIQDVGSALAAFRLFVLSSHLEGLCTSILDAMALRVPVVATEVGGVPDAVKNEETGLLVPARSPEALATGIVKMLDSPEQAQQWAENAHEKVVREFSVEQMVQGTLNVYRRILAERKVDRSMRENSNRV